nr:polypeptide N-acetylgalactosaminyltransferase 18 isoform X1 [Macaca fascicularis]XP_045227426.1 polypeptide N-acetylgalactosaminyltransferase 18 isoform X1 [Macaca fascicularis]
MPDQEGVPSLQPMTAVQGHPISNTPLMVSTALQPGFPSAPLSFPLLLEVWAPELSLLTSCCPLSHRLPHRKPAHNIPLHATQALGHLWDCSGLLEAPAKPEEAEAEPFTDSSLFAHWGQELSPEGRRVALKQFQYYGYNAYLSDRLPLDRPLPDLRPSGCRNLSFPDSLPEVSIVFIFVNEALSVLLRSIHSAIERTPPHLLKEIILVDDNSSNEELKEKLTEYVDKVNSQKPGFIKVVRHSKQEGLIRSRVSGWRAATAPVVALFDAHVEFNVGWAEPVLTRIKENRKRIISPSFDNIKYDNFEIEEYPLAAQGFDWELWCRYLNPPKAWWKLENSTAPIRSPALIGCFIVDRQYFQEIGLLDEGMEVYGGENVELGIRVWQCGGSVEVLPCSRIAHIERAHKPYTEDLTAHVRRNALRVAEVWMDEFKSHVYMAWNIPQEDSGIDIGDITARKALRKQLQCKTFRWYLVSVYPEMRMYSDIIAYGVLQNSLKTDLCLDQGPDTENVPIMYICHGMTPQNVYYTSSQQIHVGILSPTVDDDDNRCLVDVNSRPRLIECSYAKAKRMKLHWQFSQGGAIQNRKSKRCLELQENSELEFGFQLVLQECSGQHWSVTNVLRSLAS